MDETTGAAQELLCGQLEDTNESIFFFILIICGTLLSFWALLLQRDQLACVIQGNPMAADSAPPVYPIRFAAGALVVGALGYFLCAALKASQTAAAGSDCVAKRSTGVNAWAGILVLAAAVARLCDLAFVQRCQKTPSAATIIGEDSPIL